MRLQDEAYGFEVGAVDYLVKPVTAPIVQARVRTHLALADQSRHLADLVHERTCQLDSTRLSVIRTLGRAAEFKDEDTGLHVVRMSHYSRLLGRAAGMSEADADTLLNAAPMHDVGKIGIPDAILKKEGPLTRRHGGKDAPASGYRRAHYRPAGGRFGAAGNGAGGGADPP